MAKLKSKIAFKYTAKPKRKLILGGPEQELYLNNNTTYQAQDAPTTMLQNQFDAQEQEKAKRMTTIYGDQMARQLDYLQDQSAATEQRKQEEKAVKEAQKQAVVDSAKTQVTTAAGIAGKEIAKTIGSVGTISKLPKGAAGPVLSRADAKMMGIKGASRFGGQGVSATSYGSNLANLGVGVGLGLIGEGIGYLGNKRDDKLMEEQGRSQYYDDTNYSRAEFNSQLGKSTFKAAGMGSTFGPVGTGIGAAVGLAYGLGKAIHERRKTTGKNWFGESNVYDPSKDPTIIEEKNREAQLKAMTDTATAMENARMSSMMQSDVNTGFGLKNSTFEAKYGGNIKYLKGGVAKSLGRGAVEYIGKKHEKGGIDLPGNIEVEGGETEQNDYVFSATLKLPNGATYAQAHKNLIKSGASGEEIHQLALSQEAAAGRNPNQIKGMKFAKYGGPLMYETGGDKKEPDIVVGGRSKEYWKDLDAFCFKNPMHSACLSGDTKTTGNYAKIDNGLNQNIALEGTVPKGDWMGDTKNPETINTYEQYLNYMNQYSGKGKSSSNTSREVLTKKLLELDPTLNKKNIDKLNLEEFTALADKNDIYSKSSSSYSDRDILTMDNHYKGLLPNLSKEEFEFYRGRRNNPDTTIPNPANGTTLPNADLWSEDPFGKPLIGATQGVVSQSANKPAVDESGRLATPRPITADEYEFYLREKAAREANETRQTSEYGPMLKGKDITILPRKQAQLAQYNLPNITPGPTSTTFVPDEELVTQTTQPVVTNPPVTTTNPPVVTTNTTATNPTVTETNTNVNTEMPNNTPIYNSQNKTFTNVAKTKGALDYTEREKAGDIFAGENYQNKWLPLVESSLNDDAKADQILNFLENYTGQDAADTKAKLAGKTRAEKIAITRKLTSDGKPGPFHYAVESAINFISPPPPAKPGEVPKEIPKDEGTPPPVKKDYTIELPPPPTYTRTKSTSGLGLIQAIPAAIALTNNIKTKDVSPSLATGYVQPGGIGRINMGRISMEADRAASKQNQAAINQALQNMSGPGAVAGMLAAKTKADQQSLAISQAEQNANMLRAGEEAKINTGISQFNVGQAMAAQQTNAQLGQANAARMQEINKFNRQLGYARDVENREQRLAALDRGAQAITMNALANRQLDVTENLANVQDYTNAYKRYLDTVAPTLKTTTTTTEDETKTKVKFGGVKKYVSRLGDLKNNRTFKA